MKSQFFKVSIVMLLILGVFAGSTWAKSHKHKAKPSQPESISCKGKVEVTRDKTGNIETVKLKTGILIFGHTYNITLDGKGRELGEQMAGKQVNVKGLLLKKGNVEWLVVAKYSEVPSKSEKKTAKK
jgi:hypothetical protein